MVCMALTSVIWFYILYLEVSKLETDLAKEQKRPAQYIHWTIRARTLNFVEPT